MNCLLGGECELVSRDVIFAEPGHAQCVRCSQVYVATGWVPRTCAHCKLPYGNSLHDPCLGTIEDAVEACCGHGDESKRYVAIRESR